MATRLNYATQARKNASKLNGRISKAKSESTSHRAGASENNDLDDNQMKARMATSKKK